MSSYTDYKSLLADVFQYVYRQMSSNTEYKSLQADVFQ